MTTTPALRRTPLYDIHRSLGAKLVPFAGWEMPVQYPTGILAEHNAVRTGVGIFDPKLAGPKIYGGPYRIQLWRRGPNGEFVRAYAGEGPVRSQAVGGFLVAVDEGRRLRIADDEALTSFWMTPEEAERAAKEAERAAKEAALAKIAELEEKLRDAKSK